ncbi:MAG TPA: lipid II flippase MurJ, partial [Stellaceae bacterium]|nr:lipid II flippase MurJ [Stellaceae bacterium]
ASVALVVAARPILTVLFQHGIFGPAQTAATAPALAAYAMGLPAFVLIKVMAPAFYARHDTATPVKIAGLAMLANIALTFALGLFFALAQLGVALALTLSGWINALALLFLAARRGHLVLDHQARRTLPRILLAALGMGGLLWGLGFILDPAGATGLLRRILGLAVLITAGLGGYTALALALGVVDRGVLDGWRRRRR